MIYDIAGLRVCIENEYEFTTKFCREFLSADQETAAHLTAKITKEDLLAEKELSPNFSDGYIENICLYRNICLQIPRLGRMLLHASILEYDGAAYAFLGRSGTGKSTHTTLWLKYVSGSSILNGDKPILEASDGFFLAYGTPWRGKEGWGGKGFAPLKGLCFLEQAKENSIRKLTSAEVTARLFTQLLIPTEEDCAVATLELADKLITQTPAYLLQCDISEEAVKHSYEALTGKAYPQPKTNNEVVI